MYKEMDKLVMMLFHNWQVKTITIFVYVESYSNHAQHAHVCVHVQHVQCI